MPRRSLLPILVCSLVALSAAPALADKIKNPVAVFSGLDKITGRIVSFEVNVGETVQFGALQLTPRVCYTRPATETPNTTAFIEVDEVTANSDSHRIFTGWVFAASPGLHGIENPVYDIWLTDCKGGSEVIAEPKDGAPAGEPAPAPAPAKAVPEQKRPVQGRGRNALPVPQGGPPPGFEPRQPTQRIYPADPTPLPPMPIGPEE